MKLRNWIGFLVMIAAVVLAGTEGRAQRQGARAPHERPPRLRPSAGPARLCLTAP